MKKLFALLIAFIVLSCGSKESDTSKFEGEWESIKDSPGWFISIQKVEKNFTVEVKPKILSSDGFNWIASYNKEHDKLELDISNNIEGGSIIFDSKSNHIMTNWGEFRKMK